MNKKGIESAVMKAIIVLTIMSIVALIIIVIAYSIKNKIMVVG